MSKTTNEFEPHQFRTDLKRRSVRGAAHMMLGRGGQLTLNFVSLMILARLLTPADFGVVAMVSALTGFVQIFRDSGLSFATIQRAEINHAQISTLFWANLLLSLTVALIIIALAPVIAWFYGKPELIAVTAALAGATFLGGVGIQHSALLKRNLRLKDTNKALLGSEFVGVVVAVLCAHYGAGYWALVAKQVASAGCNAALLWILSGWRPSLPRAATGVWSMIRFGGALTGAQLLGILNRKIDDILIGWAWGAATLGYYSKAYGLLLLPTYQFNGPLASTVIPTLSSLQSEPERLQRYYRKAIELIAFLGYPVVVCLFVAADEAVLALLGKQWQPSVEIFRMLGPATLVEVTSCAGWWVSVSAGRGNRQLKLSLIQAPMFVAAVIAGLPWGALGVAAAVSIIRTVLELPMLHYQYKNTPFRLNDFFSAIWRPGVAALLSGFMLYGIESYVLTGITAPFVRLITMGAIYASLYLLVTLLLPGGKTRLLEMLSNFHLLKRKRPKS